MKILSGTLMALPLLLIAVPSPQVLATTTPRVTIASYPVQVALHSPITIESRVKGNTAMLYSLWMREGANAWHNVVAWQKSSRFTLTPSVVGEDLFQVDAISAAAYQRHQWQDTLFSRTSPLLVGLQSTLTVSASAVPQNNSVTLTGSAQNVINPRYQFWYETPSGVWKSSGPYTSSPSYTMTASQMGSYRAVVDVLPTGLNGASAILESASEPFESYGTPASLQISTANPVWVADGKEAGQLIIRAIDSHGDVVANENGTGSITDLTAEGAIGGWGSTSSHVVPGASIGIPFHDGVATLPIVAGETVASDSLLARLGLSDGQDISGRGTLSAVAQVASAVSVTPTSSYLIGNESGNPGTYDISVVDQVGEPLLTGTDTLTATLSGPAQFHDLTKGPDTLTYTGGEPPISETVYSMAGGLGPVTLTVTGTGLTTGAAEIPAILGGQPDQMGVSAGSTSLAIGESTTLTLTQLTASGGVSDPASLDNSGYVLTITNALGNEATGFTVGGIAYAGAPLTIPVALGPNFFYALSQPVTLEDVGAPMGIYTLVVSDADGLWKASKPMTLTITD